MSQTDMTVGCHVSVCHVPACLCLSVCLFVCLSAVLSALITLDNFTFRDVIVFIENFRKIKQSVCLSVIYSHKS